MADKFIPNRGVEFLTKAESFATAIGCDPERYFLEQRDAEGITRAVEDFRAKFLAAANKGTRSQCLIMERDEARAKAKRLIEMYGRVIRADTRIDRGDKIVLGITERPGKLKKSACPQTRPELIYVGPRHSKRVGRKVHVLKFREANSSLDDPLLPTSTAKPAGARGVEIFVELLDEHEPLPKHPGELSGGRPWYLRSFTRGPIEAEFPIADRPMRVVYWARWVGMKGDVGPFSATCVAEYEGPSMAHKAMVDQTIARRRQQSVIITTARIGLPEPADSIEALPGAAERLSMDEAA